MFAKLKKRSDYYNFHQRTVGDFFRDVGNAWLKSALADRKMWGEMRMNPTDLADVSGSTYTYLMNGVTPAGNWTGLFKPGERVRLRFINGSAMSYFDVRIPGLKMTVVAADGQYVHPVTVDEFRIADGRNLRRHRRTSRARTRSRSSRSPWTARGSPRARLAMREGLRAAVPALDARPMLTMADMGHGAMGHDMKAMSPQKPADAPAGQPAAADPDTPVTVHPRNRPRLTLMRDIRCPSSVCSDATGSTRGPHHASAAVEPIRPRGTTWRG